MNRTELLKIAKPILFNTGMVRAILDGRKTATRRLLKQPFEIHPNGYITKPKGNERLIPYVPPYQPGDIIYVRETWCTDEDMADVFEKELTHGFYYKADEIENDWVNDKDIVKWKPSIHMPKLAARIFLKVTDVRVERLHDITAEQIDAEGCKEYGYNAETGKLMPSRPTWFKIIWDNTIKKQDLDKYGWNANPWVWVYEFERVECDERK